MENICEHSRSMAKDRKNSVLLNYKIANRNR